MIEKNYDIHGQVRIRFVSRHQSILKGLDYPLSFFETDNYSKEAEIMLEIGDFSPSNQGTYLIDHKYHVDENYIYCEDRTGRTRMKFEINGIEKGPIKIKFYGKAGGIYNLIASNLLAQDQILIPMIELSLARKGLFLAHGCGIAADDGAHLFLGRGGSLKTTMVLDAASRQLKILGDDRVILDPFGRKAYSFPQFPRIMEYLVEKNRNEEMDMMTKIALILRLCKDSPKKKSLWSNEPSSLSSLNLLVRGLNVRHPEKRRIDRTTAVKMIIANNSAEESASSLPKVRKKIFAELMTAYSFTFPNNQIARYWEGIDALLRKLPDDFAFFKIEVPKEVNRDDLYKIYSEN